MTDTSRPNCGALGMHLWRSIVGLSGVMLLFRAIGALPLATAITLNYTSPLFLALIGIVVVKEKPRPSLLLAVILGFAAWRSRSVTTSVFLQRERLWRCFATNLTLLSPTQLHSILSYL